MSAQLDIIFVGYSQTDGANPSLMRADCTSCLIRSDGKNILFDTLGPWSRDSLVSKLATFKIHPDDIHFVVCSHSHPDHVGNLNLFTKAKHIVGKSIYKEDQYEFFFEKTGTYIFKSVKLNQEIEIDTFNRYEIDANLSVKPTPGHTLECVSLVIKNTPHGTVTLAGDLFEKREDLHDDGIWIGAGSQSVVQQRAHRAEVYNSSDYVVPGHGMWFPTSEKIMF